jgi:ABC-type amino acid transport substrate-binding protein
MMHPARALAMLFAFVAARGEDGLCETVSKRCMSEPDVLCDDLLATCFKMIHSERRLTADRKCLDFDSDFVWSTCMNKCEGSCIALTNALNRPEPLKILTIADGQFVTYDPLASEGNRWGGYSIEVLEKIKEQREARGDWFNYTLEQAVQTSGPNKGAQETFNGLVEAVNDRKEGDIHWAATFITENRSIGGHFTLPYAHDSLVMVRMKFTQPHSKLLPIQTLHDVKNFNRKACVLVETATDTFIRDNYPGLEIIAGQSFDDLIALVRNGNCTVAVDTRLVVEIAFATPDYCDMEVVGSEFWDANVAGAVRKTLDNAYEVAEAISFEIGLLEDIDYFYEKIETPYILDAEYACKDSGLGHHYTFITVLDPPFVQFDDGSLTNCDGTITRNATKFGNDRFSGYIMSSMAQAAELGRFTYTIELPQENDHEIVPFLKGSYQDGIDEVLDNSTAADCYWAGYFITSSRLNQSALTTPFVDTGLALVINRPKPESSPNKLFKPFTGALWTAILLLALFSGVVMWSLEAAVSNEGVDIVGSHGRTLVGFIRNLARTMYLSFSTLFGTNSHSPKTSYGRFYSFFWILFSVLILASYTANLASILSSNPLDFDINSIEDMLQLDKKLCVKANTAFGKYIEVTYPWKDNQLVWADSLLGMARLLKDNKCDALVEVQLLAEYLVTNDLDLSEKSEDCTTSTETETDLQKCQFTQVGELFWKQNMAVGCNKELADSVNDLSEHISELKSSGDFDQLRSRWFTSSACKLENDDEDEAHQLDEVDFMGPMVIFATIAILAVLLEYGRRYVKYLFDTFHAAFFGEGDKAIAKKIEAEVNPTMASPRRQRSSTSVDTGGSPAIEMAASGVQSLKPSPALQGAVTGHGTNAKAAV